MDVTAAREAIESSILGIRVSSIEHLGQGDFCAAFTVNHGWVFRFAHGAEGSARIDREAAVLPELAKSLSLRIPEIEYFARDPSTGLSFVGYHRIPGRGLSRELLRQMQAREQECVARALAEFLDCLHSFSTEYARQIGMPEYHYPTQFAEDIDRARTQAYPLMEGQLTDFCEQIVQEHLESGSLQFTPALLHDDLSQWHIFFDPSSSMITGVIDFSDMVVGDPIQDLMYLYDDYGAEFVGLILANQREADLGATLQRLHSYHEWHTLGRLLWAVENRCTARISERLGELRQLRDRI